MNKILNLIKRICTRIYYEVSVRLPVRKCDASSNIIISLTSYPARMKTLHFVIRSLLQQKTRTKNVILYLGSDTIDSDITPQLKKLLKYGLIIKTGYEDLKPHKKYFFAMQEYHEDIIITVDDDLIYDRNLIKDLVECSKKNPGCVCARRVNLMTKNKDGSIASYSNWKWEYNKLKVPSHALLATGCGGVLYPAHSFGPEAFDIQAIKKYCLNTDDIWLKFMELKYDRKVVWSANKICHPLTLRHSQDSALMATNTKGENRNDKNIRAMEAFTGIKLGSFGIDPYLK